MRQTLQTALISHWKAKLSAKPYILKGETVDHTSKLNQLFLQSKKANLAKKACQTPSIVTQHDIDKLLPNEPNITLNDEDDDDDE